MSYRNTVQKQSNHVSAQGGNDLYQAISVSTRQHERAERIEWESKDRERERGGWKNVLRHKGRGRKGEREEEEDTYREPKRRTVHRKKSERRQEASAGEGCLAHA